MKLDVLKDVVGNLPVVGRASRAAWSVGRRIRREAAWAAWRLRPRAVRAHRARPSGEPLHVGLVAHHPSLMRESKLAEAATMQGLSVTLVHASPDATVRPPDGLAGFHRVGTAPAVLDVLERSGVDLVHVVAPAMGWRLGLRVLRHAGVPSVYDPYDCTEGFLEPGHAADAGEIAVERECFAIATHVCSRSLEPAWLRRELGYEMAPTTFFADYCRRVPRRRSTRDVGSDGELHVVYAGGIRPEDRFSAELWGFSQFLEVGRILARQRVHLHLYPAPLNKGDEYFERFFSAYRREEAASPFFHLHRPVSADELARRLPEHDAALQVLGPRISEALGVNTVAKLHHASANKLFDYVEAGLPVILHAGRLQRALVRRYGELVEIDRLEDTRDALTRLLASPAPPSRSSATLAWHAPRLADMYRRVSATAKTP